MINTIDKTKVRNRFGRNISTYSREACVQKVMAGELIQKLSIFTNQNFSKVLEIGCGTGFLTNELLQSFQPNNLFVNDLIESVYYEIEKITLAHSYKSWSFLAGDAENISFPGSLDLVVSASAFQWFQDIQLFFSNISNSISTNGILAFCTFGPANFKEIKLILGKSLQYPSLNELNSWLFEPYEIIHSSEQIIPVSFNTPLDILKHIKYTGVNSLGGENLSKNDLLNFQLKYANRFTNNDGSLSLTYHPIYIIARKK